ncbi:hypothetical protein Nepgr_004551 [Nepenthes gracilis]|uniref:Uncharacterized protein n=1 Tax=Nepenthes gracilis TaxID=150966 RepID=A0AAD3XFD1_NEPGR|nr:hypothetical protein Nepgr_004551 [Nepenthes gracilis]
MPANYTNSKVQSEFKDVYEVMEISNVARRFSPPHTALSRRHSEASQIQLERLDSVTFDLKGRIPEESFEAFGLKQCFKRNGFMAPELVALSRTHTLGAGVSSMIGLPSDRALVEDDDIHLISGIAMSRLTTSSRPSPWARISLLSSAVKSEFSLWRMSLVKILELEVINLMQLKGFTHARRSSGRKTYVECILLDKLLLTMGLSNLIVAASAAWNMGEWDQMAEYISYLDDGDETQIHALENISASTDGSNNGTFFRAVMLVH